MTIRSCEISDTLLAELRAPQPVADRQLQGAVRILVDELLDRGVVRPVRDGLHGDRGIRGGRRRGPPLQLADAPAQFSDRPDVPAVAAVLPAGSSAGNSPP